MNRIYEIKKYYSKGIVKHFITANGNKVSRGYKNKNTAIVNVLELCKTYCGELEMIDDIEIEIVFKQT